MNDQQQPMDPDDVLASLRPPRGSGYLDPGSEPAAELVLASIVATPAPARRFRWRRAHTWTVVAVVGTLGVGSGVAAVLSGREDVVVTARMCMSEASRTPAQQVVVDAASTVDPVAQCQQAWTDGLLGRGVPPPMTACTTDTGAVAVVPGSGEVCATLEWRPAERNAGGSDRTGDLVGMLSDRFTDECFDGPEAVKTVNAALAELELDTWSVDDQTTNVDWCTTPSVDPATRTIVLRSFEP